MRRHLSPAGADIKKKTTPNGWFSFWSGRRGSLAVLPHRDTHAGTVNAHRAFTLAARVPCSRLVFLKSQKIKDTNRCPLFFGAGDEARTRYLDLGKVALYQMSYARKWCLRPESNWRHADFQSAALPTELPRQIWRPRRGSNPRPPA